MPQELDERTFTQEQSAAMYALLCTITHPNFRWEINPDWADLELSKILEMNPATRNFTKNPTIDNPPQADSGAPEAGVRLGWLINRNTEQAENSTEYHEGDFYAMPLIYHKREIMCWHVYDKTQGKNGYCVARNIRTRFEAENAVSEFAMNRLNAQLPQAGSDSGNGEAS